MLIVSTFYRKQTTSLNRVNNLRLKCQKMIVLKFHSVISLPLTISVLKSVWRTFFQRFKYVSRRTLNFHAHFVPLTTCKLPGHCSRTVSVMLNAHLIPSLPTEFFATFLLHLDPLLCRSGFLHFHDLYFLTSTLSFSLSIDHALLFHHCPSDSKETTKNKRKKKKKKRAKTRVFFAPSRISHFARVHCP